MKKIALMFFLAVFVPSLFLAWLAVRSLRDQNLVLERQQFLLYQSVAESLAKRASYLALCQREFGEQVEAILANQPSEAEIASTFDQKLRAAWPPAELGFVTHSQGELLCPAANSEPAKTFCAENAEFLSNSPFMHGSPPGFQRLNNYTVDLYAAPGRLSASLAYAKRPASPWKQVNEPSNSWTVMACDSGRAFGGSSGGILTHLVGRKNELMLWHRTDGYPALVFGALLSMQKFKENAAPALEQLPPDLRKQICIALLDDKGSPVKISPEGSKMDWKHPFAASHLDEPLPTWQMAVYLLDPSKLAASALTIECTLGLLIGISVLAIGVGSFLIVSSLNRQMALARQKTDFVSNVSHELKTPLTSIRMFAELLAEGRVEDRAKAQSYLAIISAEASRLTRLINNVLDFSRLERGEKKYHFQPCDLAAMLRETVETYRPHLEADGFNFHADLPPQPLNVSGDRDALAQVAVNLLSNAEKYSNGQKEISVEVETVARPSPHVDVRVLDRGPGVPAGCEKKIFEQFFRAHDSLASGIEGSGLGLTLARQIARAHGGDVLYRPREGGGSCFILRLPLPAA